MFTARYVMNPYITQICFIFKGLRGSYHSRKIISTPPPSPDSAPSISPYRELCTVSIIACTGVRQLQQFHQLHHSNLSQVSEHKHDGITVFTHGFIAVTTRNRIFTLHAVSFFHVHLTFSI
jgi:hypothetical protein